MTRAQAQPFPGPGPGSGPVFPPLLRVSALSFLCFAAALAQPGQPAPAQPSYSLQDSNLKPALPGALQGVGIDQKLNEQVPLDLVFRDEAGRDVPLSSFFQSGKPVILVPVYYRCPMLCTQILAGVESSLKAVSLESGAGFRGGQPSASIPRIRRRRPPPRSSCICGATAARAPPTAGIS